ncbi:NAD(P)/FAD-dependent oxidoreductase [Paludibacterium denitrificans]|uniref:FAD-dependent oxidoreductase n=1 Tax=Paludibacterium denitrificans TaxID=2675226 RepID=A0A844GBI6_9NEIS|nr:FAD-binding oxidoreductase [Paludibacterium denitrificans]MTD33866.1 FAD-dependent oxidoreductase [Paludibacterium denitrificans]
MQSPFERQRIYNPAPDTSVTRRALQRLKEERPELAQVKLDGVRAGRIDLTPDLVPVISGVDGITGLVVATGFSGHGFGIGPGAGKLAADLIRGVTPIVDAMPFSLARFNNGTPIFIDPDVI